MKRISKEQKVEFIKSNMNVIPQKSIETFKMMDIDKQYKRVRSYLYKANHKDSPKKVTISKTISDYLKSKNAKYDVVKSIADKCQKWIDETNVRKADELRKEITKLQKELNKYDTNKQLGIAA